MKRDNPAITLQCGSAAIAEIDFERPGETATEYHREVGGECEVLQVGKLRNGAPKAWCKTHARLVRDPAATRCAAHGSTLTLRCLSLDITGYEGGIGIWGSLPPAINTASAGMDTESLLQGVHVHARRAPKVKKEVDETYDLVALFRGAERVVVIDTGSATALVQSRIAGLPTRLIRCPRCDAEHVDEGWFAVNAHRKHQCLCCGREFWQINGDAGNPIEARLIDAFGPSNLEWVPASRTIDLGKHLDAARHIRIWGTHQALVWTAVRPEESGVHVHVYNSAGEYVVDETFDTAIWRDTVLDADEVRLLMLQKCLSHLDGKIQSVECTTCRVPIRSAGVAAVEAHREHVCPKCGDTTTTARKVVSNPLATFRAV